MQADLPEHLQLNPNPFMKTLKQENELEALKNKSAPVLRDRNKSMSLVKALNLITEAIKISQRNEKARVGLESVFDFFEQYDPYVKRQFHSWEWPVIFSKFDHLKPEVWETISFHNSRIAPLKAGHVEYEYLRE